MCPQKKTQLILYFVQAHLKEIPLVFLYRSNDVERCNVKAQCGHYKCPYREEPAEPTEAPILTPMCIVDKV